MRRALNQQGQESPQGTRLSEPIGGSRPRHRFAQDGDVPVTVLQHRTRTGNPLAMPSTSRAAAAEAALAMERACRDQADRELKDALSTIRDLQTKLGHADLARQEAQEALQADYREREARLQRQMLNERNARTTIEAALREMEAECALLRSRQPAALALAQSRPKQVKAASKTRASKGAEREPKPVKWWIKSTAR